MLVPRVSMFRRLLVAHTAHSPLTATTATATFCRMAATMRAVVVEAFGGPEVLQVAVSLLLSASLCPLCVCVCVSVCVFLAGPIT